MREVWNSAMGIGDSTCALYAACGLADALGEVTYHVRHFDWLTDFSHPNLTLVRHQDNMHMGSDMNWDYDKQLQTASSRKQWYTDNVLRSWNIQAHVTPVAPKFITKPAPVITDKKNYVLISPFADYSSRTYQNVHWARVVDLLYDRGIEVVVIGLDQERLRSAFGKTPAPYFWGQSTAWVRSAIANAACVIGNDSGIPHIAGLYNVPTVAVMAHLAPSMVFSHTNVVAITPPAPCSPCSWQGSRGWRQSCDELGCSALQSISPETIVGRVIKLL